MYSHVNYLPSCAVWLRNNHLLLKGFILASVVHHCRNGTYGKDAASILRQMGFTAYVGLVGLVCSPNQFSYFELWTEAERNSSVYSKLVHSFLLSAPLPFRCFCPLKPVQLFYPQPKEKIKFTMYISILSVRLFQQERLFPE